MRRWWRSLDPGAKFGFIGVLVTVVGIVLATWLGWLALGSSAQGGPPTTKEIAAPTTLAAPTTTSDATDTTPAASETSTAAAAMVTKYLSSDYEDTLDSQQIPWFAGAVQDQGLQEINGTQYPHNLTFNFECSYFREKYADYNLGKHYERFRAVIGPGDTSTQSYHFEIWRDGERAYSVTLRHGQTRKIDLSVKNVLTLRVGACGLGYEPDFDRGGVYGDPRVIGKASEVPPPTTTG